MTRELLKVFQKFLMHVLFGADIDGVNEVTIMVRKSKTDLFSPLNCTLS